MSRKTPILWADSKREIYTPELVFNFATLFLVRNVSGRDTQILWTLSRDRQESDIWTPPGGEVIFPDKPENDFQLDFAGTALRETEEEVGVKAMLLEFGTFGPFYIACLPFAYQEYRALISNDKRKNSESGRLIKTCGCHAQFHYYAGMATRNSPEPFCRPQPDEPESETVDLKWLSLNDSLQAILHQELKTYATIEEALKKLTIILNVRQSA